jgi:hypothetical protein
MTTVRIGDLDSGDEFQTILTERLGMVFGEVKGEGREVSLTHVSGNPDERYEEKTIHVNVVVELLRKDPTRD